MLVCCYATVPTHHASCTGRHVDPAESLFWLLAFTNLPGARLARAPNTTVVHVLPSLASPVFTLISPSKDSNMEAVARRWHSQTLIRFAWCGHAHVRYGYAGDESQNWQDSRWYKSRLQLENPRKPRAKNIYSHGPCHNTTNPQRKRCLCLLKNATVSSTDSAGGVSN